jgi:hypothetical protein
VEVDIDEEIEFPFVELVCVPFEADPVRLAPPPVPVFAAPGIVPVYDALYDDICSRYVAGMGAMVAL